MDKLLYDLWPAIPLTPLSMVDVLIDVDLTVIKVEHKSEFELTKDTS